MALDFDRYLKPCDDYLTLFKTLATSAGKDSNDGDVRATSSLSPGELLQSVPDRSSTSEGSCSWTCNDYSQADRDELSSSTDSEADEDDQSPSDLVRHRQAWIASALPRNRHAPAVIKPVLVGNSSSCSSPMMRRQRMSLPANLSHWLTKNDPPTQTVQAKRRRSSAGVKFADEVGENLTTFAIIPSRFDDAPLTRTQSGGALTRSTTLRCPALDRYNALTSLLKWADEYSSMSLSSDDDDRTCAAAGRPAKYTLPGTDQPHELTTSFRLTFDQPAADPTSFQRRLDDQLICLENVKVEDDAGCHGVSVLCTVKVKRLHVEEQKREEEDLDGSRVFARCTNDDWKTYADITAQHIGIVRPGMAGHGARTVGYETFSFAVQRPVTLPAKGRARPAASRAVEFALCYKVDARQSYWDNNRGRNYRIQWRS